MSNETNNRLNAEEIYKAMPFNTWLNTTKTDKIHFLDAMNKALIQSQEKDKMLATINSAIPNSYFPDRDLDERVIKYINELKKQIEEMKLENEEAKEILTHYKNLNK